MFGWCVICTHFCIGALAGEQKFSIAGGTTFAKDLNCNGMEDHLRDCPRLPLNDGSLTPCSDPLRSAYIVCQGTYVLYRSCIATNCCMETILQATVAMLRLFDINELKY